MSGRIRTLKPEILEDERTASLSHEAWRLFVSLILMADDHGRFRASPKFIEGQTFWARESAISVAGLLHELAASDLLELYTVRGQEYGCFRSWKKHQRVDKPSKPRCPGPEEADSSGNLANSGNPREVLANDSRDSSENLAPDHDHRPRPTTDDREPPESSSSSERDDAETVMRPDFKLPDAAVEELAKHYKHSPAVILEAIERFKGYWVIGPGMGKRRSHWASKCRGDIKTKAENGELDKIAKSLGASAQEATPPAELASARAAAEARKQANLARLAASLKTPEAS